MLYFCGLLCENSNLDTVDRPHNNNELQEKEKRTINKPLILGESNYFNYNDNMTHYWDQLPAFPWRYQF